MEKEQIKQLANKYLNDIVKQRNPENWMDYITDSWMHNAEVWFCNEYEIVTGFACPQDKIDTFKVCIYCEANRACDKKYGIRNGGYIVNSAYRDIKYLQESLKTVIAMYKNGDNPNNEYIPINEINGAIALLKEAENKLSKLAERL